MRAWFWNCTAVGLLFGFQLAAPLSSFAHHSYPPTPAQVTQERIVLMRHAEKPDNEFDPNLTPAGFNRATNLAKFVLSQYGKPDYIFVAANSKKSSRPYETAVPLSQASGIPIDTSFKDKDYKDLALLLLSDQRFAGKLIVVIWHHGVIPDFAEALQAKDGSYPTDWNSNVYNKILQFDYVGKKHPVVAQVTEPF